MGHLIISLLCAAYPAHGDNCQRDGSFLYRPAFSLGDELLAPAGPYAPQPGDIFLATDQALWARAGYWLAGSGGVHHAGLMFLRTDGRVGLLEAGPCNYVRVAVLDPIDHMRAHALAGDKVWVRRRRVPLTPEESARLTAFADEQNGKPFALARLVSQLTPLRARGPLRTCLVGQPHGDRDCYFGSELVVEACVAAGLMDGATARPSATYPRDLFFGRSVNLYLDAHLHMEAWAPPARWVEWP